MKVVGYCAECGNPIGDNEIGTHCHRCELLLVSRSIVQDAPKPVTKQNGRDLFKRNYKKMIPGVRNRSSRKGL